MVKPNVLPFPGMVAESPTKGRHVETRPGVGNSFELVYFDEAGYPLLVWQCDAGVSKEWRERIMRLLKAAGDDSQSSASRAPVTFFPRLLR